MAVFLILLVAVPAWYFFKDNDKAEVPEDAPIAVADAEANAASEPLNPAMTNYFQLRDALVAADTGLATNAATALGQSLQQVDWKSWKADTSLVQLAATLSNDVVTEANAVAEANNIASKREHFQRVSAHLFDVLRTVQYRGQPIYQLYCPMAFDDKGAAWLSNKTTIANPYFGNKMLTCGEVRDSLSF